MTPHNEANIDDIAKVVIMPGDPLRAKYIAENFLTDYKLVNKIRNAFAYTGYYKNKKITVMASGMGIPSMGIYSYELFKFYNVDYIIRIGTAGSYSEKLDLLDLFLVKQSYSESTFSKVQNGDLNNIICSSELLDSIIEKEALKSNLKLTSGTAHCSDVFYTEKSIYKEMYEKYNCLAVEMESYALFHNAKVLNKNAACILSISDSFVNKKELTGKQRETGLNNMINLALESALHLS